MRYKPEHKEETHRRIVDHASKEFRAHGFESVGIANLMGALKLTHGGFYAHFADKEALVGESVTWALRQNREVLTSLLEAGGLTGLIDYYLSDEHHDQLSQGCPLPALSAEVARRSPESRDTFTAGLADVFDEIAPHLPGDTEAQRRANVQFLFAALTGAVSLARAVSDPAESKSIRESTRDHLARVFIETPP